MQENHNRELGQLSANIKTLTDSQNSFRIEMKGSLDQVFSKLNNISENGCAIGKFNDQRITKLEERPDKNATFWANVASIIAMAVAGIAFWKHGG